MKTQHSVFALALAVGALSLPAHAAAGPLMVEPGAGAMMDSTTGVTPGGRMRSNIVDENGAMPPTMPGGMRPMMQPGMPGAMPMMPMAAMDQLFMVRAMEGNLAEVTMSALALDKSKNANVRAVAQRLVTEHGQAQTQLLNAARAKGMKPMPMLSAGHAAIYNALRKAKKNDFDKLYMAAQVDDHENTIALFQTEIAGGSDADAKAFATQLLPGIVAHTVQIYAVARSVGAPGMEMRPMMPPIPPGVDADAVMAMNRSMMQGGMMPGMTPAMMNAAATTGGDLQGGAMQDSTKGGMTPAPGMMQPGMNGGTMTGQ